MNILVILGVILIVVGVLGLFAVLALTQTWSIVAIVAGLLMVFLSTERGRFVR